MVRYSNYWIFRAWVVHVDSTPCDSISAKLDCHSISAANRIIHWDSYSD